MSTVPLPQMLRGRKTAHTSHILHTALPFMVCPLPSIWKPISLGYLHIGLYNTEFPPHIFL